FFGEREAVKIAFAESGTTIVEQSLSHGTVADPQFINLANLTVPNTLVSGLNAGKLFVVDAVAIVGSIDVVDEATRRTEADVYSVNLRQGDLLNFSVMSGSLNRYQG